MLQITKKQEKKKPWKLNFSIQSLSFLQISKWTAAHWREVGLANYFICTEPKLLRGETQGPQKTKTRDTETIDTRKRKNAIIWAGIYACHLHQSPATQVALYFLMDNVPEYFNTANSQHLPLCRQVMAEFDSFLTQTEHHWLSSVPELAWLCLS